MFVQAFDTSAGQYYKSVVYAIIKRTCVPMLGVPECMIQDEELAILYNPIINCFELLPEFDSAWKIVTNIPTRDIKLNYIVIQPERIGWKALAETQIGQYSDYGITSVMGYTDIIDQTAVIRKLLTDKRVGTQETGIRIRKPEDFSDWTYILTQKDADDLISAYDAFHDATIDQIHYEESDTRAFVVTVRLSVCDEQILQLCFEGVIALNLRTQIEWQREMAYTALTVGDRLITWVVDGAAQNLPNENTGIQALSLKWRVIQ